MKLDENCQSRLQYLISTIDEYTIVDNESSFNALFRKLLTNEENNYDDYVGALVYLFRQQDIDVSAINLILELIKEKNKLACNDEQQQVDNLFAILTCIEMVATIDGELEKSLEMYEYMFENYKQDFLKDLSICRENLLLPLYRGYFTLDNRNKAYKYALASAQIAESAYDAYQACRFYCIHTKDLSDDLLNAMLKVSALQANECKFSDDFEGVLLTNIFLSSYFSDKENYDSARKCYEKIVNLCDNYKKYPMTPRVLHRYESQIDGVRKAALNGIKKLENAALTINEKQQYNWKNLSPESKKNLEQAELLRDLFDLGDDYSPAVLPLFKALERELYKICITKYYDWAENADDIDTAGSWFNYVNKILKKQEGVAVEESFALGKVVTFIIADRKNNIYKIKSPFKAFLDSLPSAKNPNKDAYDKITHICEEIHGTIDLTGKRTEEIIPLKDYRNMCAHGNPNDLDFIDRNAADDCFDRVPAIIKDLLEIFY